MTFFQSQPWHEGEEQIHKLTHVDRREDNPTSPFLTPRAALQVQRYPLLALGTLDSHDRPWTTLWGAGDDKMPMAQPVAKSVIGIRATVDARFDPVVEAIWRGKDDGEVIKEERMEGARMVSGLSIQLEERARVKVFGRMVAGALSRKDDDDTPKKDDTEEEESLGRAGEAQLVLKIEQSLGNCPKYLNKKKITSHTPQPKLLSESPHLTQQAMDLIAKADLFFVSSAHEHEDMDTNHRGGPPGFIRVQQPTDSADPSILVWPEYSGNNLYQTLGNLMTTPKAGIVIPDFETGDVLYLTGTTNVLVGADATKVIAKSNLAVKFTTVAVRHVQSGLPFRGTPTQDATLGRSPYNPRIRHLASEKTDQFGKDGPKDEAPSTAMLVNKTKITPTINRYRFALADPAVIGPWKPGQYVALDFSAELDMGYSHMRDDDPMSLNDDYIRTFTVSSVPDTLGEHGEEFEITVRRVGNVTTWLGWQREGMAEVGVRGFGGEFKFEMEGGRTVGFVAAGIGITPLLGQMADLDVQRTTIWWSVGVKDIGLVLDVLKQYPQLKQKMTVFVTGDESVLDDKGKEQLQRAVDTGIKLERRRLRRDDLTASVDEVDDWYLCTAPAMRMQVQDWLPGKSVVFENFDY